MQARREAELLHAKEVSQLAFMQHPTMIKVLGKNRVPIAYEIAVADHH